MLDCLRGGGRLVRGWAGADGGVQNANTHRGKLEGEAASWRRAWGWGVGVGGFLGLEPHPDNDIQKSNSEVSNNDGASVDLRGWTGARRGFNLPLMPDWLGGTFPRTPWKSESGRSLAGLLSSPLLLFAG